MHTDNKTKIAIVGAGWIGQQLIERLATSQYELIATARSQERLETLAHMGAEAKQLSLPATQNEIKQTGITNCDWVIIAITPGFKRKQTDYGSNVAAIVDICCPIKNPSSQVKGVILLSSTGVYSELTGHVDEQTPIPAMTEKTRILRQAEQAVTSFDGRHYVLRLAGLFGKNREPGKFMAGKRDLPNGDQPINMVNGDDVVASLNTLLTLSRDEAASGIYNCVANEHPSKQAFYQAAARRMNLPEPEFTNCKAQISQNERIVLGDKLQSLPQLKFCCNDLMQWLSSTPERH